MDQPSLEQKIADQILAHIVTFPGAKYVALFAGSSKPQKTKDLSTGLKDWLLTGKYVPGILSQDIITYMNRDDIDIFWKMNYMMEIITGELVSSTSMENKLTFVPYIVDYIKSVGDISETIDKIKCGIAIYDTLLGTGQEGRHREWSNWKYQLEWILTGVGNEQMSSYQLDKLIKNFIIRPDSITELIDRPMYSFPETVMNRLHMYNNGIKYTHEERLKWLAENLPKMELYLPYLPRLNCLFKPLFSVPVAPEVPTIK